MEKQERRRGKRETERKGGRGCEGDRQTDRQTDKQTEGERQTERDRQAERQRGRESGQRFRLVILVVTSGLIFVDVVLVVVEVAAWSSSKERKRRGREEGEDGREGGTVRQRERQRQRRRGIVFCGSVLRQLPSKKPVVFVLYIQRLCLSVCLSVSLFSLSIYLSSPLSVSLPLSPSLSLYLSSRLSLPLPLFLSLSASVCIPPSLSSSPTRSKCFRLVVLGSNFLDHVMVVVERAAWG